MNEKLMGVFAPITTPFTADGTVDYSGLEHNVRAYAKSGLKGFLALGSNGENKSLTNEEKLKVLEIICTCKREDQVVMAGCIFESTFETIEMAHRMEAYHPDFLTLLPPNYFKKQMTDDDVMAGSINNFFMGMVTGASGGVLSLADSFPDITVELYRLLASKHYDKAVALNDRILQINKIVSGKGGVAAVKYAMDLNGLVGGYPRLPLLPLAEEDKAGIREKLAAEGLL